MWTRREMIKDGNCISLFSRIMVVVMLLMTMLVGEVNGLSSSSGMMSGSDIQIVGMPGGTPQSLPYSYVQRFPRWSVEEVGDDNNHQSLKSLPGTISNMQDEDEGFVNPTSIQELWWPKDLEVLQIRPTLDVLLQSGMPKYAAGGLQVRTLSGGEKKEWRNYGMNSQPLARQWTTFGFAVEPEFRVETFLGQLPTSQENENDNDDNEKKKGVEWEVLKTSSADDMKQTLERMAGFLSQVEEDDALLMGFHILSIPTVTEWTDLPQPAMSTALVALATAEPDAQELLDMDNGLIALTATSILAVQLSQIESGKKK